MKDKKILLSEEEVNTLISGLILYRYRLKVEEELFGRVYLSEERMVKKIQKKMLKELKSFGTKGFK
jgi:hypothetical protein